MLPAHEPETPHSMPYAPPVAAVPSKVKVPEVAVNMPAKDMPSMYCPVPVVPVKVTLPVVVILHKPPLEMPASVAPVPVMVALPAPGLTVTLPFTHVLAPVAVS